MPLRALETAWRDVRLGMRRITRAPIFAAFSIVTIALGIGVTTAAYSVVYDFALRDLGVLDRARLMSIEQSALSHANFSWPEYADLSSQQSAFSSVCSWTWFQTSITGKHAAELASAEAVSGNFFETLGARAARGRLIQPDDDRQDAPAVAVLSDQAWRMQFDADPGIVGTNIRAAGRVFTVIGVAVPAFHGASRFGQFQQSLWIPLTQAPGRGGKAKLNLSNREERWLNVIGRLAPGRTVVEAQPQLAGIASRLEAASPLARQPNAPRRIVAAPAFDDRAMWAATPVFFVLSIPALVLLVACTNLTNLVLSRGVSRQHEFAIRRALGGSRWQVVREQIADGAIVAVVGGVGGVVLASTLISYIDGRILEAFGSWPQLKFSAHLQPPVLMMAAGATLLALTVSTVLPILQLTRRRGNALGVDVTLGGVPRWRGRSNLIALQVAVSVGLFLVTALGLTALRTDVHLAVQTGQDRVAAVDVPLAAQQRDDARGRVLVDRLMDEARQVPHARVVELATMTFSNNIQTTLAAITSPERPFVPKRNDGERVWMTTITPGALPLMGVSLRYGRPFDDRDSAGAAPAIIVNAQLAIKTFGRADAVGREALIQVFEPFARESEIRSVTIVGVAGDSRDVTGRQIQNALYVPYAQHFESNVRLLARADADDLGPLVTGLRQAVRRADPDLAISFAGRADSAGQVAPLFALKMFTTALAALASTALILAMVGLYGVLTHVVGMRTRELGLRQALGADAARIVRLVLRDGFRPVAEGLLIGCAGAAAIRLMLQPSFEKAVTAFDPIAIGLAAGPLLVAAAIACYVPARRAARIDPNVALRDL
jgi:putative ABC transport system permease protein